MIWKVFTGIPWRFADFRARRARRGPPPLIHVRRCAKKAGTLGTMEVSRIKVWQCVGCGRIDDPQPCIGICRDEKREYVPAAEHDRVVAALGAVLRTIAATTPREGEALRHWRALQRRAREALDGL
ncbi:MAG TPA: hypothetical protein VN598_08355 [Usitatibacter sp.]|nr:hypothetical protein [Usitatibacter sp.]